MKSSQMKKKYFVGDEKLIIIIFSDEKSYLVHEYRKLCNLMYKKKVYPIWDSNPRPRDQASHALPAELTGLT